MIKDFLQGKPLGHPLHPMLVHLPIGLFFLSFIFDIASKSVDAGDRSRAFVLPAFYTMSVGVFFALVAAVPGLADYSSIRRDHPARKAATWHMILNVAVVALYIVNLVIRNRTHDPFATAVATTPFLLSVVAIVLLSISGWLGGKMVYNDGIGVGRHRRRTRTPRQTIVTDGTIAERDLADGETLRLDINDTIVTVAKVDGQVYAFQEFCTHRFGPLSEGTFEGTTVKCPWHGSCFDMRSGKVTEGPAKEDIRAFEVEVRDGQVRIRVTDGV
jgi:uncharacterized membrane protein/nitrite reductase/ring-hydroxylating ferredoxin subunit